MAIKLQMDGAITGIKISQTEYKLTLYTDDIVFFLTNPLETLPRLHDMLAYYGRVSGYEINYEKMYFMGVNIS